MEEVAAASDGNNSDDDSWMSLRGSVVELADEDEVNSVVTEESQWQFVDSEEAVLPNEADILKAAESRAREIHAGGTFVDLTEEEGSEHSRQTYELVEKDLLGAEKAIDVEAAKPRTSELAAEGGKTCAASLLAINPLRVLAFGGGVAEIDDSFRGDVTGNWAAALAAFPSVAGAFCVGRLCLAPSAQAVVLARVAVVNSCSDDWPEETALRLVAGEAHGLAEFPLGAVPAGHGADLQLDIHVTAPPDATVGKGQRSAWVFSDGHGTPFGPLVVFEVLWI